MTDLDRPALIVIDVQRGFADPTFWGRRDNPDSPLAPGSPGNAFQEVITGTPDLMVTKSVNSSFHGAPDLHAWLQAEGISSVVICGITTNHCCETTARVAGNLGYDTFFAIDATHTFDRTAPDGQVVPAEVLSRITATNLHGEFATVTTTAQLLAAR